MFPEGFIRGIKPNIDHAKVAMFRDLVYEQVPEKCQVWPGTIDRKGYGRVWYGGRWRLAHHVIWEVIKGPLQDDMTLDHFLMNEAPSACSKACVNLLHLEPVSNVVNVMRGRGACAQHARQTHCKRGHEFTAENTYVHRLGKRECRACDRWRHQRGDQ